MNNTPAKPINHICKQLLSLLAVLIVLSVPLSVARGEGFDDLLVRLPADANAIVLLDADRIFSSLIAKSENWRDKYASSFESTPLMLPPSATRFVLAAELEVENMTPVWEAAVMTLAVDTSVKQIADRRSGLVDSFAACTRLAAALYGSTIHRMVPVSSTGTAEMVKLLENTFRAVNIGLVNETAMICDRLGINVWEVIDAAGTKPFGFMPF